MANPDKYRNFGFRQAFYAHFVDKGIACFNSDVKTLGVDQYKSLKQWLADRLAFLDTNIDRFDSDWQPRIQPLVEKKMQFPW